MQISDITNNHRRRNQRGSTLILHVLMLTGTVAAVGLAVDVGSIYMIRARLSSAVDAAALAAGRSVNLANSVATATTNATTTAQQFFNANFPAGYLNAIGTPTVTPTFTQVTDGNGNPTGTLNIAVSAAVSAPTYFMNIFNISNVNVTASGTASRRGVVLMLVLDQSSSMNTSADPVTGLTACQAMVQAAQNFITLFSPYDQIGLVTFDITAHLTYAPSSSYGDGTLNTDIGNITCGSNTNTISALELAYQEIQGVGLPLAENEIVLFTDGSPNGISAQYALKTVRDSRWGPALSSPAPPTQHGSTFGQTNSCNDVGPSDSNGVNDEAICIDMPAVCTSAGPMTSYGTLAQWGDQNSWGGTTYGLAPPTDSYSNPSFSSYGCSGANGGTTNIRQYIDYIPDNDMYGNSLHGVTATGTGPTVTGGLVTRDYWIYQVNSLCSPDSTVTPNCKNTGGEWSGFTSTGSGCNFFPSTSNGCTTYTDSYTTTNTGKFRPDQSNSIVAASMNGTMAAAYTIRSDTTYHPMINVIYLTGNGTDSVDREFLPIVANYPTIPALPYDPLSYTPYTNPAFQTGQESGKYFVTANRNDLNSLFAQLASEVLRLSK
jgi:Flp pilus assembly protein TadG